MELEELLKILNNSNLKSVSRDTGIPNDRMYKWKQGKGKPKKEDFETLVSYFINGISSESSDKPPSNESQLDLINSLRETIRSKDETIQALRDRVEDLKARLSMYEDKPKTGTN